MTTVDSLVLSAERPTEPELIRYTLPTAADTLTLRPVEAPTLTYASLASWTTELRDQVEGIDRDAKHVDRVAKLGALDESTALTARRDPEDLLDELAGHWGLSWTTIARLVGVSPTAIRKWRRGEAITGVNRRRLARVVAFLETLRTMHLGDLASWLEMPLSDQATLTVSDLYAANRIDLVLELAGGRVTVEHAFDAFDPDWRATHAVDERFEVVQTAPDGFPAIVERRGGRT